MTNLVVGIDKNVEKYIVSEVKNINIYDLFNTFGVDLHYLIKEKEYNKSFKNDLVEGNFTISNSF